jgi:hypothetical protein
MAKAKKVYKQGATIAEIEAQLVNFNLFGDGEALDFIPEADKARPAKPPKAVRLDWDPVERIDTDAAWDAFLRHA